MTGRQARETAPLSDRASAPPGRRPCEVTANRESGGYRIFSALDRSGPEPLAGQFYMLVAADGWGQRDGRPYLPRAFSVAEATPAEDGLRLDFLVEAVGPGTERLAGLRPGEGLWVTGPLGRPFSAPHELAPDAAGAILVGGGIGIAPLAILRRQLARHGDPRPHPDRISRSPPLRRSRGAVRLLRGPAGQRGRPHRAPRLRDRPARGAARGRRGAKRRRSTPAGRPAMLEAVRAMCARAQVAAELAMEAPMACGFGACFGCAVPLAAGGFMRLCVDGPVVNAAEIDTALVPGSGH